MSDRRSSPRRLCECAWVIQPRLGFLVYVSLPLDLPLNYTGWGPIAQNRDDWHRRVTQPPFAIGKPFVRRPRGDTRRTPEQKREDEARRAAETAERQANFDAASHAHHNTYS